MILLDSDIVIDFLRARTSMAPILGLKEVGISVITQLEIEYGFARRPNPKQLSLFIEMQKSINIIPVSGDISKTFAYLQKYLFDRNQMIHFADMVIASQAVHYQMLLVTRNLKHFSRIPKIRIKKINELTHESL